MPLLEPDAGPDLGPTLGQRGFGSQPAGGPDALRKGDKNFRLLIAQTRGQAVPDKTVERASGLYDRVEHPSRNQGVDA